MTQPLALTRWHAYTQSHDPAMLSAMLHDDVVFHSPVVHTLQRGKAITFLYLRAALDVLGNDSFTYVQEFHNAHGAVLEFNVVVDGIQIDGIDMISWDADGLITEFKVMVRPLKAVNLLHGKMAAMLDAMKAAKPN
jgi:hypothetical protein